MKPYCCDFLPGEFVSHGAGDLLCVQEPPRKEPPATEEHLVAVGCDQDIVAARRKGRQQAEECGFSPAVQTLIATAISELARNIVLYADRGDITLRSLTDGTRRGIAIVATDQGPGIHDVDQALKEGFSTSGGLGLGLIGTRRLMDEFEIDSRVGKGTRITVKKWI